MLVKSNVRSPDSVDGLIKWTLTTLGHIDAVIYNPGAIFWASLIETPIKRYQLMHEVNTLGLYATVQSILPQFYAQNKGSISYCLATYL